MAAFLVVPAAALLPAATALPVLVPVFAPVVPAVVPAVAPVPVFAPVVPAVAPVPVFVPAVLAPSVPPRESVEAAGFASFLVVSTALVVRPVLPVSWAAAPVPVDQ